MKKMNKVCSLILVLALMLSLIPAAYAAHPFTDVEAGKWYTPYVEYCYENGLMNGTDDTTFSPNTKMNRAMVVTVLHRIAGGASPSSSGPFTDVPRDSYYSKAVAWTYERGVTTGTSATEFSPMKDISRQELVTFFYRYAKAIRLDVSNAADLSSYKDNADVAAWASEAMSWAVAEGIINGMGDNTLAPKGTATRAECAAVIQRFAEWSGIEFKGKEEVEEEANLTVDEQAAKVYNDMVAYGESLGMTFVDLTVAENIPADHTVDFAYASAMFTNISEELIAKSTTNAVTSVYTAMKTNFSQYMYFHIRQIKNSTGFQWEIRYLRFNGDYEAEELDFEELAQFGRDYAYETYGFDGNPNCTPETNANYLPADTVDIYTMEQAKECVKSCIDRLHRDLTKAGDPIYVERENGRIDRCVLNIKVEHHAGLTYKIWTYYGGTAEPSRQDYWKDPNEPTVPPTGESSTEPSTEPTDPHIHEWEFLKYTGGASIYEDPEFVVYECVSCGTTQEVDYTVDSEWGIGGQ